MNKELIAQQEAANDGRSIFLFFDHMTGVYLAFGLSAYYVTMVIEPYLSFSDEMQMPVVLLRKEHILWLRQGLHKIEHKPKEFYRFEMKEYVGKDGYDRWMKRNFTK